MRVARDEWRVGGPSRLASQSTELDGEAGGSGLGVDGRVSEAGRLGASVAWAVSREPAPTPVAGAARTPVPDGSLDDAARPVDQDPAAADPAVGAGLKLTTPAS